MPTARLNRTVLGKYFLRGLLAAGGQSEIYAASAPGGEMAAVKIALPTSVDEHSGRRMEQEAELLARLHSPRFARYVDSGYDPEIGVFCLVQELLPGVSLDLLFQRAEWLEANATLQVARQVAEGLEELHTLGFVMRDLSPAQVIVHGDRDGVRAWLVDLGLVRPGHGRSDLTDPAAMVGTPGYTAPELVSGRTASPRSDVYSLAALTYAMLSGRSPFAGKSNEGTVALQLLGEPPPLDAAHLHLEQEEQVRLENLLNAALSTDETSRPATPGDFVRALEECLPGRTVTRHSPWKTAAVCAATATAAALLAWWWFLRD